MIKIKHADQKATQAIRDMLSLWKDSIEIYYDEFAELYDIEIGDDIPVFLKYWSGVNDNAAYLHVGSKILAIEGAIEIC